MAGWETPPFSEHSNIGPPRVFFRVGKRSLPAFEEMAVLEGVLS